MKTRTPCTINNNGIIVDRVGAPLFPEFILKAVNAHDELVKALQKIEALPKFGNKDFGQQVSLIARTALEKVGA